MLQLDLLHVSLGKGAVTVYETCRQAMDRVCYPPARYPACLRSRSFWFYCSITGWSASWHSLSYYFMNLMLLWPVIVALILTANPHPQAGARRPRRNPGSVRTASRPLPRPCRAAGEHPRRSAAAARDARSCMVGVLVYAGLASWQLGAEQRGVPG